MSIKKWTYKKDIVCTYTLSSDFDDDDRDILYKYQLLDILDIPLDAIIRDTIDESPIDDRVNDLFQATKENQEVKEYIASYIERNPLHQNYNEITIFKLLFSFDEFANFHRVLQKII